MDICIGVSVVFINSVFINIFCVIVDFLILILVVGMILIYVLVWNRELISLENSFVDIFLNI